MFTGVKLTRSGIPVPLDSSGREMCLLFIKYGRCRFKNKCKKSHWMPPLPDEEYPIPPPLPLSPPPSFSVSDTATGRQYTSQDVCMADKQKQNFSTCEASHNQNKSTAHLEIRNNTSVWTPSDCGRSVSQGFFNTHQTFKQEGHELSNLHVDETTVETQILMHHQHPGDDSNDNEPASTSNNVTMSPAYTSTANLKGDVSINIEKEIQGLESADVGPAAVDSRVRIQTVGTAMDKISQVIYTKSCRFDFVYHPVRRQKGAVWKYKSSIDQSYQQYGAYYDHAGKKLGFRHQPGNKVEKKNLKLLRRAHWNTCQELKTRLAQLPPGYSLRVDLTRVNFSRLRPYLYLLVHQCFFCEVPTDKRWKPTPFSCLVAETLITLFITGNITPTEAEKRMQEWGGRPVRVRQCISHLWNIIVKSSLSTAGVAQEVVNCEQQVFAKKLSAVDYAYACILAGPSVKGNSSNLEKNSVPMITASVRQGLQATKKASILQAKRTLLKPPRVDANVSSRTNNKTAVASTRTLDYGVRKPKGVCLKKKRKTKRSRQLSILDEQGKQDLLKRCKTILAECHAKE